MHAVGDEILPQPGFGSENFVRLPVERRLIEFKAAPAADPMVKSNTRPHSLVRIWRTFNNFGLAFRYVQVSVASELKKHSKHIRNAEGAVIRMSLAGLVRT